LRFFTSFDILHSYKSILQYILNQEFNDNNNNNDQFFFSIEIVDFAVENDHHHNNVTQRSPDSNI
ncbi:hypothetical protein DERP_011669, partial [Dermatophagoides pteronyssinus]